MSVKQSAGRHRFLAQQLSKLLHTALYYVIYLSNLLHETLLYVAQSIRQFFETPPALPDCMPAHVGLSGGISSHVSDICDLISLLAARGTVHISLYDPSKAFDTKLLTQSLELCDLNARVREVGCFGERDVSVLRTGVKDQGGDADIVVTAVHPGADRDVLVRAAQQLAEEDSQRGVKEVSEWLDGQAEGMLPSEPDVVVIFPEKGSPAVRTLQGFPIWQLRLTQFRFPSMPITTISEDTFLHMVAGAASAPKRFGR